MKRGERRYVKRAPVVRSADGQAGRKAGSQENWREGRQVRREGKENGKGGVQGGEVIGGREGRGELTEHHASSASWFYVLSP